MKKLSLLFLTVASFLFTSCGKVLRNQATNLSRNLPYKITITVNMSSQLFEVDPVIYIKARDVEVNRIEKEIVIHGPAFISDKVPHPHL